MIRNEICINAEGKKSLTEIHFLQLNLAHRLWAHEALMAWLHTQEVSWILCLQEPYFSQKGMTKLPNTYGAFWNDSNIDGQGRSKPRAAIISPKGLKGYMVTQFSNMDCVTVRFDKLGISVISGYCPSDMDMGRSIELILCEMQERKNVICCLDGNAYHPRWGSNLKKNLGWRGRHRGSELIEIIDENDLIICNQLPHLATYVRDSVIKDESHIDITLCTRSLFNCIDGWKVKDETYMSDHRVILFSWCTQEKGVVIDEIDHGIPWKKPPAQMKQVMEKALLHTIHGKVRFQTMEDVNRFISKHCTEIRRVLEKVFRKKGKHSSQVFWWTKEVAIVYQRLRLARRRMRRYKHQNLRQEFVSCRKEFRETVRKAKTDAWKDFTSNIGDPWSKLLKIVKATSVGKMLSRTLHDLNGVYANDLSDTLVLLGKQFYPEPDMKMEYHITIEGEVNNALVNLNAGPEITICELRVALRQMSAATAPGFDTITNNVIQCLATKTDIERTYLGMLNWCLKNAFFPEAWKKAKVVLIPKPTTESNSTKSFRPISLTSSYAKLFERIILARILHYLTLSDSLSNNQHAYQKGRSTQTALFEVFDVVQYALHRRRGDKNVCMIVFLDITGAFDRTWHYGILHKLLQYEVPGYLVALVKSFLCDRTAFFMDNDVSHEVNLAQGCPQGGVLSPILWNVLFNEMLALPVYSGEKKQNRVKIVGYADDAAIVCKAGNVDEASMLINMHLGKIHEWSKKFRIKFNPAKLAVLTITNRLERPPPASIFYDGMLIKEVSQYKYLGLIVDMKCSWKPHMESVLGKLALVTRSLRGLSRSNWGVSLEIYRMLFHAIFMPIMTYGISIWGWKATNKNMCAKFDKEIRTYGLLATRCLKSTSSKYIFGLLNTQNFESILRFQVLKTSVQQFHIIETKRKSVYDNYRSKRIKREVPQCLDHHFYMCRRMAGGMLENTEHIEFQDVNQLFFIHPSKWVQTDVRIDDCITAIWKGTDSRGWVLYTDASRSTHGIGWGLAVFKNGLCVHRNSGALTECSIFAAEAFALLQATLYVDSLVISKQSEIVEIRTDSQSLAKALEKEGGLDSTLSNIKSVLRKLHFKGKRVQIRWVPSHCDINGNETADRLAKKATDNRHRVRMAVTTRDIKQFLKQRENCDKMASWASFQSRNVKFFLPDVVSLQSFLKSNPSVSLCQIVSGHTRLNDFLCTKLGLIRSSMCECGKADETITHFLLECDLYEHIRSEIWPDFESSYAYIMKDWKLLNEFVIRTKRFSQNVRQALLANE